MAEIDANSKDNIKDHEWRFRFNSLRRNNNIYLFDWKDLGKGLSLRRYVFGNDESKELREGGNLDGLDIVHIGQLGRIYQRVEQFNNFLDNLGCFGGRVINPLETIRGNLSKQYLVDLYEKGVPVIPTIQLPNNLSLEEACDMEFSGWSERIEDIVSKPKNFGERGEDVVTLSSFNSDEEFQNYLHENRNVLAQPLIRDLYTGGENSLIFLRGRFIYGVNKFTGDFKVNASEGTMYARHFPGEKELDIARRAISDWPTPFDYVRVDMVNSENPLIMEVEMVNPSFYESR